MNTEIMSARVTKSLMYPEQGTPEYFIRHKFVVRKAIENAIIEKGYECYVQDFDLWIGFDDKQDKIFEYLDNLGYEVEKQDCHGLGIKISWGY